MFRSALTLGLAVFAAFSQDRTPSTPRSSAPFGDVWASCTGSTDSPSGQLVHLNLASGAFHRFVTISGAPAEHEPLGIAILPDGLNALVPQLLGSGTRRQTTRLQTVTLADGTVTKQVTFDGWLDALEFHPTTGALWGMHCDNEGVRRLVRVDAKRGKLDIVGTLPDTEFPRCLAFTPNGRELWALTCTNERAKDALLRLDPNNAKVLKRFPWATEHPAHALEIDAAGRFIAVEWGGTFYELDASTGRPTRISTVSDVTRAGVMTGLVSAPSASTGAPARPGR